MAESMPAYDKQYTYADLLSWPGDERWELIDGVAYDMSPAPTRRHQDISGALFNQLYTALEGSPCRVYSAPFDVRLPRMSESGLTATTVLQPDISVICDPEKLDDRGCVGAPTLVIEILSPDSTQRDLRDKFHAYARAGVPEYWVVLPNELTVMVFKLTAPGHYGEPTVFVNDEKAPVSVMEGVVIELDRVF